MDREKNGNLNNRPLRALEGSKARSTFPGSAWIIWSSPSIPVYGLEAHEGSAAKLAWAGSPICNDPKGRRPRKTSFPTRNNGRPTLEPSCCSWTRNSSCAFCNIFFQKLRVTSGPWGGVHGTPRNATFPNESAGEGQLGDKIGERASLHGVRRHLVSRRLFLPADKN